MILLIFACLSPEELMPLKNQFWNREYIRSELQSPPEAVDTDPAPNAIRIQLTAAHHQHEIMDWKTEETILVDGYAYNGTTPGPTIRAKIGDFVQVQLTNALETPTTIHWHGLDVPNEMDGTPMVQPLIQPGDTFTYEFTVQKAGTAWYHPHFDTDHQVNHGLYGAFIVEDPDEPHFENELIAILDDWDFATADDDPAHHNHDTYTEGNWTINGLVDPLLEVLDGPLSVRIINASNFGYAQLALPDGSVQVGNDAGLLSKPNPSNSLLLTPGDREHVLVPLSDTTSSFIKSPFSHHGGVTLEEPEILWQVKSDAPAVIDLDSFNFDSALPSEDFNHTDAYFVFQGNPYTMRWTINGEVFPDVTPHTFELGKPAIWELRNLSPTHHPFHLHGMTFEVLSRNGIPPETRQMEDTIDLGLYERVRILVPMDNPGTWMTHCHILPHGDNGMMAVIQVE